MSIEISSVTDHKGILSFTMKNTNKSIVNALRRTIIGSLPAVVMKQENCKISVNTTRFNNEILKQRLASIPVHIPPDSNLEAYSIHLKKSNATSSIVYVTSEDFEVTLNGKLIKSPFHPSAIGTYIDILRLRPKMELAVESIELTATLSLATGNQSGTFNLANCSYRCTVNEVEAESKWAKTGNSNKDEYIDWNIKNENILRDHEFEGASQNYKEDYIDWTLNKEYYLKDYEFGAATQKQKEKYIDWKIKNDKSIEKYEFEEATQEQKEKHIDKLLKAYWKFFQDYELEAATPEQKERYKEYAKD